MVRRTVLCAIVSAAVCVPALLGVVSASQPSAQPVPVDADDLGGVVTSAAGPRGRRLGHRRDAGPADEVRADRRHRRSGPLPPSRPAEGELQRLGARLRAGGFAARSQAAPGQRVESDRGRSRPMRARRRSTTRRVTGSRCCGARRRRVPRHRPSGNGISPDDDEPGASGCATLKSGGCCGCHQLGNKATREIPAALGTFPSRCTRGSGDPVGAGGRQHDQWR